MTVTSSGIKCDVCDNFILGLTGDDLAYPFKLTVMVNELHACKDCIKIIKKLDGSDVGSWKQLPQGNLRRFFEEKEKMVTK